MRLSLLLFTCLCLTGSTYAQSLIRLKNLQLGPAFSIQANNQDATVQDLGPITKDPQHFPNWNIDGMKKNWRLFQLDIPIGAHVSLLTTWDFYSDRKKKYNDNKEWKIGVEYTTFQHRSWPFRSIDENGTDKINFRRKSQHMGVYSDFVFKKHIRKRSTYAYIGAGGSLTYTVSGRVEETKKHIENSTVVSDEKYEHATNSRRDIALLLPMGFEFWGSRSVSRVGLNIGMQPGIVLIKEKMLPLFTSPVMRFTARLIYNLH